MHYIIMVLFISLLSELSVSANHKANQNHPGLFLNNISTSDSTNILIRHSDSLITVSANTAYAKEILKKYVNVIGSEDLLRSMKDRVIDMKGIVQGVETEITFYQKSPNKLCQKIIVGEVEQKIIFDGLKGMKIIGEIYQEIMGDELVKLSFDAIMNLILEPETYNVKLQYSGLEKIDGRDSYKILLTLPNGAEWIQYYDLETGLKIRDSKDIITPQGKFQQITEFDDYRDVEGVRYPFKLKQYLGSQTLDFTIESIQVNIGISDEIFLIEQ